MSSAISISSSMIRMVCMYEQGSLFLYIYILHMVTF